MKLNNQINQLIKSINNIFKYKMASVSVENMNNTNVSNESNVITFTMDEHPFREIMYMHRLQIVEEFGADVLDKAYKLYSDILNLEKHYMRCNNYSEAYINTNVDMKEVERKFLGIVESEYGINRYYHKMLMDYCDVRYNGRIIKVNDDKSMEFFLVKLTDADEIRRAIRRIEFQMDRLPMSVFNTGSTQYEIYGDYMEMCVHDLKILLNYAE